MNNSNNSKEQTKQQQANQGKSFNANGMVDKKLDGPNRPAE